MAALRNKVESPRSVVPVRLSDRERERISKAAKARDLAFSSFVRTAALEAASDQLLRAKPKPRPRPVEHEPVILRNDIKSSTPEVSFLPHSFVDGEGQGCGLDLNDHRGRDRSCTPHGREMVMV